MTQITDLLDATERVATRRLSALKKFADRLSKTRKALGDNSRVLPLLCELIVEIRKLPRELSGPECDALIEGLNHKVTEIGGKRRKELPTSLRDAAETAGLSFRVSGEHFAIGPFGVLVDYAKGTATLDYAKIEVARDLPLDPAVLLTEIERLRVDLLAPVDDRKTFTQQLEETVRVVAARQRKSLSGDELRAELPLVYREMLFLRQGWANPTAKRKLTDYPVTRFVVEVKTCVQSEENVDSSRRFRLEPAVIENTKNFNKALFFPNDISDGSGEGMYFQAIIHTQHR